MVNLRQANTMTRFTLGVNTYFTSTRWPRPCEKLRLVREELNLNCLQYSLDGFEAGWPAAYRKRLAAEIREAAARYSISIHSVFTGSGHHDNSFLYHPDRQWRQYCLRWFKAAIIFAAEIGARGAGGFTGALSLAEAARPELCRKRIEQAQQLLWELAEKAAACGLEFFLIEPMSVRREPPATVEETLEMMERLNERAALPIRLCLDVGHHLAVSGSKAERDPYHWLRKCSRWAEAVHLHQTDSKASRHWPFTPAFNRRGLIRAEKVLQALIRSGVSEMTLLVEIFVPFYEPRDSQAITEVRESVAYWRRALNNSQFQ